jgi:AraC-like DNA-binding protein
VIDANAVHIDAARRVTTSMRHGLPGFPILAFSDADTAAIVALKPLIRLGIDGVIIASASKPVQPMARLLADARSHALLFAIRKCLRKNVTLKADRLLTYCLHHPKSARNVIAVSRAMHISRRTLYDWCVEARLPRPEEIIGWCRLLHAAERIAYARLTAVRTADELGFPSASALRNQLKRYTGLRPRELSNNGVGQILALLRKKVDSSAPLVESKVS